MPKQTEFVSTKRGGVPKLKLKIEAELSIRQINNLMLFKHFQKELMDPKQAPGEARKLQELAEKIPGFFAFAPPVMALEMSEEEFEGGEQDTLMRIMLALYWRTVTIYTFSLMARFAGPRLKS